MAYKTGRGRTLVAEGTLSGAYQQRVKEFQYAHEVKPSFSAGAFGSTVSASYSDGKWNVSASGPGGSDNQSEDIVATYDTDGSGGLTQNLDIGGKFKISVPVEEWVDITASPPGDVDNGIVDYPPRYYLRFYEMTAAGGTASAMITSGGITAQYSGTIGSPSEIGYGASLSGSLSAINGDYPTKPAVSGILKATLTAAGANLVGTESGSADGCSVSDTSGVNVNVSVAAIQPGEPGYSEGGVRNGRRGRSASVSLGASAPKSFDVSGVIAAMDAPYPGPVTLSCSRYLGDPDPSLAGGASFQRGYSQRRFSGSAQIVDTSPDTGIPSTLYSGSSGADEWQPLTLALDAQWCKDNDEYATYIVTDDAGNQSLRYVYDDRVDMHGWTFGGAGLTQAASLVIDPCTSASGWTGAAVGTGGLTNTGASMVRNFAPAKNLSGYRYLRLRVKATKAGPMTLTLKGKVWKVQVGTDFADVDIDLCDAPNMPWTSGNMDTRWPVADPSLSYSEDDGGGVQDTPDWGVSYCPVLTLSGLDTGTTYTLASISQVRKGAVTLHVLPSYRPRFDADMIQLVPIVTNDSGTVTTTKCRRFLMADTDGRQSFEFRDIEVSRVEGGGSGVTYYVLGQATIGDVGGILPSADAGYPAGQYPGWTGSLSAPPPDGSQNLKNGYLNSSLPSSWLYGGGMLYEAGTGGAAGTWKSGLGLDASGGVSLPAQVLFSSIEWYPGIGDVFGFADGAQGGGLTLVAHKILRGQAHGLLLKDSHGPAAGQAVELTQTQPVDTPLAAGTSAAPVTVGTGAGDDQGAYRTHGGPGALGWAHSTDSGSPPLISTSSGQGTVKTKA